MGPRSGMSSPSFNRCDDSLRLALPTAGITGRNTTGPERGAPLDQVTPGFVTDKQPEESEL